MRTCLICGEDLVGKRKDAKYCCKKCRLLGYAKRELKTKTMRTLDFTHPWLTHTYKDEDDQT